MESKPLYVKSRSNLHSRFKAGRQSGQVAAGGASSLTMPHELAGGGSGDETLRQRNEAEKRLLEAEGETKRDHHHVS
jgi:hypothetical protein